MEQLIKGSTAYKIFCREAAAGRLAHAYMLSFNDPANLRRALTVFALRFFGVAEADRTGGQIVRGTYPDCKLLPEEGKKFNAEAAVALIEDCAMRPAAGDRKLYLISSFDECSPVVQNKLLKVIEEPPEGANFILGAAALSPVLPTILSRVRLLEIPPFTEGEIYAALERNFPGGELNRNAAASCGGVYGTAVALAGGEFAEVHSAALELLSVRDCGGAGTLSLKYGDSRYKRQLVAEMQRLCCGAAKAAALGSDDRELLKLTLLWRLPALIKGAESFSSALRDLKFNAYYPALIYSALTGMIEENRKWQK